MVNQDSINNADSVADSAGVDSNTTDPPKRFLMASFGVFFVVVAGVGVFLPGIPTVGPLILASVFLTKSSPALEKRLIRNRFFARYLPYLDGSEEMTLGARLISILLMWTSITISCFALHYSGRGPIWLLCILVVAGAIGTVFILRFGKRKNRSDVHSA